MGLFKGFFCIKNHLHKSQDKLIPVESDVVKCGGGDISVFDASLLRVSVSFGVLLHILKGDRGVVEQVLLSEVKQQEDEEEENRNEDDQVEDTPHYEVGS